MKPALLIAVLPAFLGFLGMFALGWNIASPSATEAGNEDSSQINVSISPRQRMKSSRESGIVAQQMQAIRNETTQIERMRKTVALANSLPVSEFAAWAEGDRFDFRQGPELDVFRMILFERWLKEDPESLIPWADKNNHGQAGRALLFLANQNPERLINFYRSNPNEKAELRNLQEIAKNHPTLALQRLQELSAAGLSNNGGYMCDELLKRLAKSSYAALEAALESFAPNLKVAAENALIGQRLTTSFETEIRALWERPDGWNVFQSCLSNDDLAQKLIGEISNLPAFWKASLANGYNQVIERNAKQWLEADLEQAGFSPAQIRQLRSQALRKTALSDPEYAFKHLDELRDNEGAKKDLISNAMRSAKGDEVKAEKLISMLSSEEDKRLAREELGIAELANRDAKDQKPEVWLQTFGKFNGEHQNSYEASNQLQGWDPAKIAELRRQFHELPHDQKQNVARAVSAGSDASGIDPSFVGDAIRYLVAHPPAVVAGQEWRNDNQNMASSTHAVRLSMKDPEEATSWINSLPDGDAKLWAFKNVAANWQQYDPKAVDQWMKTLPTATRNEVSGYLQSQK